MMPAKLDVWIMRIGAFISGFMGLKYLSDMYRLENTEQSMMFGVLWFLAAIMFTIPLGISRIIEAINKQREHVGNDQN